jgi:hypothetical protein
VAVLAGQTAVAGQVPGERIATDIDTADTSTFTAETVVMTVTAALVTGRTYRVRFVGTMQSDVTDDTINSRLREDNVSGTQLQLRRAQSPTSSAGSGVGMDVEAEYTAVATGDKTFVATGARSTGTGNITCEASATQPRYLYVDYIRG